LVVYYRKATVRKIFKGLLSLIALALLAVIVLGSIATYLYFRRDRRVSHLDSMPPPRAGETIIIFAPHEDDEILGTGGYIQRAVAVGAKVHVVFMTNGEFPKIDVILFEHSLSKNPQPFIQLGYMRQQESLRALHFLGVSTANVTFLGYPNGYLFRMWEPAHWLPHDAVTSARTLSTHSPYHNSYTLRADYCGQAALDDIEKILHDVQPDVVIALHPNDIHVDHWPTYAFVQFALQELADRGEGFAAKAHVYTYLIHHPPWPERQGYSPSLPLLPPASLVQIQQTDWRRFPLTRAETVRKHQALAYFHTQGGGYDPLLEAFPRANELFGIIPMQFWPALYNVPAKEIIRDPAADSSNSLTYPNGDILSVTLGLAHNAMTTGIRVYGLVGKNVVYHFELHGGGVAPADRVFVEYDWSADSISGLMLRDGQLQWLDTGSMKIASSRDVTTMSAPWPLLGTHDTFFMARAWTTIAHRDAIIDQTAETTLRLSAK